MINLLPPLELFLPFWIAGIALNLTPGADMAIAVMSGVRGGRMAGLAAAAGTFTGSLGHILMAVLGLSTLLLTFPAVFNLLKFVGVLYLGFMAWRLVWPVVSADAQAREQANAITLKQAFRQATLINLLNPKVGLFFLAFLPQFVEPDLDKPWQQILCLGLVFNVTGTVINSIIALAAAAGAHRFAGQALWSRLARYFAAGILLLLAIRLALQTASGF